MPGIFLRARAITERYKGPAWVELTFQNETDMKQIHKSEGERRSGEK